MSRWKFKAHKYGITVSVSYSLKYIYSFNIRTAQRSQTFPDLAMFFLLLYMYDASYSVPSILEYPTYTIQLLSYPVEKCLFDEMTRLTTAFELLLTIVIKN